MFKVEDLDETRAPLLDHLIELRQQLGHRQAAMPPRGQWFPGLMTDLRHDDRGCHIFECKYSRHAMDGMQFANAHSLRAFGLRCVL